MLCFDLSVQWVLLSRPIIPQHIFWQHRYTIALYVMLSRAGEGWLLKIGRLSNSLLQDDPAKSIRCFRSDLRLGKGLCIFCIFFQIFPYYQNICAIASSKSKVTSSTVHNFIRWWRDSIISKWWIFCSEASHVVKRTEHTKQLQQV